MAGHLQHQEQRILATEEAIGGRQIGNERHRLDGVGRVREAGRKRAARGGIQPCRQVVLCTGDIGRRGLGGGARQAPAVARSEVAGQRTAFGRKPIVGLELVDPAADQIEARQKIVGQGGIEDDRTVAHRAQQVFGGVHQMDQGGEIEKTGRSLDRMHRAEHAVDRLLFARIGLEGEQRIIGFLEQVPRFAHKAAAQVLGFGRHFSATPVNSRAAATSRSGWIGLNR